MERLFEIQRIIIEQKPFFWREQFDQFLATEHVCGVIGARGVGKTTFLLRIALQTYAVHSLYETMKEEESKNPR